MFGGNYGGSVDSNDIFIIELTPDTVVVRYCYYIVYIIVVIAFQ